MDMFQKIVLAIAVFLLILILIFFIIMMRMKKTNTVFPPIRQTCPDGWASDSSGNCYFVGKNGGTAISSNGTLTNVGANVITQFPLYTATNMNGTISFKTSNNPFGTLSNAPLDNSITNTVIFNSNDSAWSGKGGQPICAQQKFANQYNIYWDGVSNTNQCSTSKSSS
jgi:hypothetical protein